MNVVCDRFVIEGVFNDTFSFEDCVRILKKEICQYGSPTSSIHRFEVKIEKIDSLNWLSQQKEPWKFYWSSREGGFEGAALGSLLEVPLGEKLTSSSRCYGVGNFCDDLPVLVLPRFEIITEGQDSIFACHVLREEFSFLEGVFKQLDDLNFSLNIPGESCFFYKRRQDFPDYSKWKQNVLLAIDQVKKGDLDKIVLARKVELTLSSELSPFEIILKMKKLNPECFNFCFSPDGEKTFVGCSPELLYSRSGSLVKSEAVAGTRSRGRTMEEDERYGQELLSSAKDLKEHRFVVDYINNSFDELCFDFEDSGDVSLLKKRYWQHLNLSFEGKLRKGISDREIVSTLHPTPAVGGVPAKDISTLIRDIEGFDRGYYAGPIGWASRDAAEFAVGIRSAILCGKQLTLFSGAGIVRDSCPAEEYQELETKLSNFLTLFKS
ncbi:MAG: menaquinone-specific isochorismate synthase [Chlamydiales bacterium]|jgi:menaquinone-specific isochorismate synthase